MVIWGDDVLIIVLSTWYPNASKTIGLNPHLSVGFYHLEIPYFWTDFARHMRCLLLIKKCRWFHRHLPYIFQRFNLGTVFPAIFRDRISPSIRKTTSFWDGQVTDKQAVYSVPKEKASNFLDKARVVFFGVEDESAELIIEDHVGTRKP